MNSDLGVTETTTPISKFPRMLVTRIVEKALDVCTVSLSLGEGTRAVKLNDDLLFNETRRN